MAVCTKLFISSRWDANDIMDVVKAEFDAKAKFRLHDFAPNFVTIQFTYAGSEPRQLSIHSSVDRAGFTGTLLDLNLNGSAEKIMNIFALRFGGFLNASDMNETYVAFEGSIGSESNDMDFWVKQAAKNGLKFRSPAEFGKWAQEQQDAMKNSTKAVL